MGGTFHVALGAGYPETGSLNTCVIHWDMICDMRQDSEIRVDGVVIYRDGQFIWTLDLSEAGRRLPRLFVF